MRLLHAKTHELYEFLNDDDTPDFAILSHTWGVEEVTLQQLHQADAKERAGYLKIELSCQQALRDGLGWVWIDTCCIDKTSTAELSEAINSMFRWYRNAKICYAYLCDVKSLDDLPQSRWFTRGWTLQELVAPADIQFYGFDWQHFGSKVDLCTQLSSSSGIEEQVLRTGQFFHVNIARKMSWAARRKTTRIEDEAYCLLGIFDVNMPLLYGEGKKAFARLQEEIMKTSNDQSLFAWGLTENPKTIHQLLNEEISHDIQDFHGLFAGSPSDFTCSNAITVLENPVHGIPPILSNKGVRIELQVINGSHKLAYAALFCTMTDHYDSYLGFPLLPWGQNSHARFKELILIPARDLASGSNPYSAPSVCLIKAPSWVPEKETIMTALYIRPNKSLRDNYVLDHIACAAHTQLSQDEVIRWSTCHLDQLHAVLYFTPKPIHEQNLKSDSRNNAGVVDGGPYKRPSQRWDVALAPPKIEPVVQPRFALLVGGTLTSPWVEYVTLLSDRNADAEFNSLLSGGTVAPLAKFAATKMQLTEALDRNQLGILRDRRRARLVEAVAFYRSTQHVSYWRPGKTFHRYGIYSPTPPGDTYN